MTKVKTQLSLINTNIDFNMVTNKDIYRTLIRNQVTKPYLLQFWENKLGKQEINWKCIYKQINCFYDNRLKQFRYKLINNIINTNENLFRWKILPSPLCLSCYTYCDLEHFFISCPLLNELWHVIISNLSKYIAKPLNKLSNIVLGYNNNEIEYFDLNLLFTIVGFSIYKYNVVSENRRKYCNLLKLFYYECKLAYMYHMTKGHMSYVLKLFVE